MSREASAHDDGALRGSSGMTEADWRRLHARVVPNPISLDSFRAALTAGRLQDEYLAKDLHKIMQELRDILREHGELREAANFPLSGRKDDLARAAAAAVRVLDARAREATASASPQSPLPPLARQQQPHAQQHELTATSPPALLLVQRPRVPAAAAVLRGGAPDDGRDDARSSGSAARSSSDKISTSPEQGDVAQTATTTSLGSTALTPASSSRRARTPPITDHLDALPPSPSPLDGDAATTTTTTASEAAQRDNNNNIAATAATWATATTSSLFPPATTTAMMSGGGNGGPFSRRWPPTSLLSSSTLSLQRAAGDGAPSLSATAGTLNNNSNSSSNNSNDKTAGMVHSVAASHELALLNAHASPFGQILSVVRRFQLRYGSYPLRFDVPVQYAQAVNSRRLRVHVLPLHHPNLPARWPGPREIVVYVNEQTVTTPWRRAWPEREAGVAKTYLSLDITHFLARGGAAQRVQFDVFHKDYCAPAMIAVVQPFAVDEVVDRVVLSHFADVRLPQIVADLLRSSDDANDGDGGDARAAADGARRDDDDSGSSTTMARRAAIAQHDAHVLAFYKRLLDDDDDDDDKANGSSSQHTHTRTRNTDDDDELVEVDDPVITTRCPISRTPMDIPIRGVRCRHLQCVDLRAYVQSGQKACYWNCPLCDSELRVGDVEIDTVLWRTLARTRAHCPPHLRLTVQHVDAAATTTTTTDATTTAAAAHQSSLRALRRYAWQPSRPAGVGEDIVVDDSASDDDERDDAHTAAAAAAPVLRDAVKMEEAHDATPQHDTDNARQHEDNATDDNDDDNSSMLRKRVRDAVPPDEGSVDCPIEL